MPSPVYFLGPALGLRASLSIYSQEPEKVANKSIGFMTKELARSKVDEAKMEIDFCEK